MKKRLLFILFVTLTVTVFSQTTYIVNSTADLPDINLNDNDCVTANGNCTLRAAIQNANKTNNKDTIEFNIPGNAPFTITVNSVYGVMEPIQEPLIIDGRTQLNYINSPIIEIDGSSLPIGSNGVQLLIGSTGSEIYGLSIGGFKRQDISPFGFGFGVLSKTGNHIFQSNYIGIKPDGTTINSNGDGLFFDNTGGNLVGGTQPNQGNVISGNGSGLTFQGATTNSAATNNIVQGNLIGTDATGTLNKGNTFNVQFIDAPNNTLGGNIAAARNIISGANSSTNNTVGTGIAITGNESYGNSIIGNYIGTDINGTQSITNIRAGVMVLFGAHDNAIGTDAVGEGNIISGNGQYGVYLQGDIAKPVVSNSFKGNYIGVDASGNVAMPNSAGIMMLTGENNNNIIGGTTPNSKNVISGNSNLGVSIVSGKNNQIIGNYIGTNAAGTNAVANNYGVSIGDGNNTVGGQVLGSRNIISGNITGIDISKTTSSGTLIIGNYIGLNASGNAAIPNTTGISLFTTSINSVIGGTDPLERNIISGNTNYGIIVWGTSHSIKNNYIGLDASGTIALPNTTGIILMPSSANCIVGGANPVERNIISGNSDVGIYGYGASHTIRNNYIGLNPTGNGVIKNGNVGFTFNGTSTNTQVSENTISGNGTVSSTSRNVNLFGANGVRFFSNKVGTLPDGITGVVNVGSGILLNSATNNIIGGDSEIEGNVIGNHNLQAVVVIASSSNNIFSHNKIGVGADGTTNLGNSSTGILIGGTNTGNSISHNLIVNNQKGVELSPSSGTPTRVTISENSIYNNSVLGIDLVGTTANDVDDPDTGVNNLQNTPEISAINYLGGGTIEITYAVPSSITNSAYPLTIEFFGAVSGQGKFFINSDIYTAVGSKTVTLNLPSGYYPTDFNNIVATATDANGNTSEFGVSINYTLSIAQLENHSVKIYPNPVSDRLFIQSPASESYHLKLVNVLGEVILIQNNNTSSTSLDVSNLSKGLYFLNIGSENNSTQTIKFIKN